MLMVLGVACLALLAAAMVGRVWIASRQARTMADTAAVSAASAMAYGAGDPCLTAARVVSAEGGKMASCLVDGEDVTVSVDHRLGGRLGGRLDVTVGATSRAGPVACR